MPIPALIPKDEGANALGESSNILPFPGVQAVRATLQQRILAHSIDAALVHGFSLYVAKWASVVMTLYYSGEIGQVGLGAGSFFSSVMGFAMPKIWLVSFCLLSFVYVVGLHNWFGRTLGKALLGLRIVDQQGSRPPISSAIKRYGVYALTYFSCGAIFVMGYHDDITQTRVVREK